jgi:hypothetical protein
MTMCRTNTHVPNTVFGISRNRQTKSRIVSPCADVPKASKGALASTRHPCADVPSIGRGGMGGISKFGSGIRKRSERVWAHTGARRTEGVARRCSAGVPEGATPSRRPGHRQLAAGGKVPPPPREPVLARRRAATGPFPRDTVSRGKSRAAHARSRAYSRVPIGECES